MDRQSTETAVKDWRNGTTKAERLGAALLAIEKYEKVDPQAPLGGPDGAKDILCTKDGAKWIAACYFPTTSVSLSQITKKLKGDAKGIKKHNAGGIIFFVNQHIKLSERVALADAIKPHKLELYHLERMRAILDLPQGYGVRLEYLGIPMNQEEQLGLWGYFKDNLSEGITSLHNKMDALMTRTMSISTDLTALPSTLLSAQAKLSIAPTATLTEEQVFWIHRTLMSDSPNFRDGFRNVIVWLGNSNGEKAIFTPIPPEEIPEKFSAMLSSWRDSYPTLINADKSNIINALTDFHYTFLTIHPFLDGNGRVARSILQQQVKELLNKDIRAVFADDPSTYYESLKKANQGDLKPLGALITASLE